MPLLDLAQRQVGAETNTQGWLPIPVMEFIARELDMPYIRVFEVATFYHNFDATKDEAPAPSLTLRVCDSLSCALAVLGLGIAVSAFLGRTGAGSILLART